MQMREIERPNARIHLRQRPAADGRWVVFLPGAGMDGHMFDAQLPAIPDELGIVAWDARGHGRSTLEGGFDYADMVEDLRTLIAGLNAEEVTLIGQSLGGNLAQTYLARRPQDVTRLVLIGCTDNHGPLGGFERLGLWTAGPILSALPWSWTVEQSARICGAEAETAAYARHCLEGIGKRRFVEVMGFWRRALGPDPEYRLPIPTLLLCGDKDRSGNIRTAMPRMADRNESARLVILEGAAHNANMDRPEETNRHLAGFIGAP